MIKKETYVEKKCLWSISLTQELPDSRLEKSILNSLPYALAYKIAQKITVQKAIHL